MKSKNISRHCFPVNLVLVCVKFLHWNDIAKIMNSEEINTSLDAFSSEISPVAVGLSVSESVCARVLLSRAEVIP